MRFSKSFTLEPEISEYVTSTKGNGSASDRVNDLLRRAMLQEKYELLEKEAAAFFSAASTKERTEADAFQRAAIRTLERD
jgi:hypothetical protein